MSNCADVPLNYQNDAEVEVKDIIYERNDKNFVEVLHGKFVVHIRRDHQDTEIVLTFYKCAPGTAGDCKENPREFIESIDCKRFQTDQTGPWAMFAPAIDKRNVCVEFKGEFEINGAKIAAPYLEKYMTIEEGRYRWVEASSKRSKLLTQSFSRIKVIHHLPGTTMDVKNLRGCIELDFDILP